MKHRPLLIVIGGGAAGFFTAVNAARLHPGLQVSVVEKTNKLLSKVKISGGGRCNVTHACFEIPELVKKYPRGGNVLKKSFHHFYTQNTIDWFQERGVKLHAEADGRMFPTTNNSQTIIDCLLAEANRYQVKIVTGAGVNAIHPKAKGFDLDVQYAHGTGVLHADYVVIATGGQPKLSMFDWLSPLGLNIIPPQPSLFTFNLPKHPITGLMGVSVARAAVKITGTRLIETGPVLITHWGLSGPAVLKLSAWGATELADLKYQFNVQINWLPEFNDQTIVPAMQSLRFGKATQQIITKSPFAAIPNRLWQFLVKTAGIPEQMRWADLPAKSENKLIQQLVNFTVAVNGKTTFKEEFVTAGGIDTKEIVPQTLEFKKYPGLFAAGEVLNIDGITGGFNFQNAWTNGFLIAEALGAKL